MAALAPELLVQLEPGRFRADNLLGAEDWDDALYSCLDDRLDPAHLFPSLDPDPMLDCAFDGGGSASPPDPPWSQEPPQSGPDFQVKSEPGSPTSSHSSDSSCASEPQIWAPSPPEMGLKVEPLPQEPPAEPPGGVKAEGPPPQPLPPGGGPPKTLLLQPLPHGTATHLHVSGPAVLLPGGLLCLPLPPPAPPKGHAHKGGGAGAGGGAAIAPGPAPATPGAPPLDVRALRRQQRMIKNRESASASRRRRKEYLQHLEQRLHLAMADNERLRRDNGDLRRRLLELQGQVRPAPPVPGPRKLACVGALLLLTFHLGTLSLPQAGPAPRAPPPPPRGRRHLLEVTDLGAPPPSKVWGPLPHPRTPFRNSSLAPWAPPGSPECRSFNRTESLRLADELRGWVRRHQIHRGTPGGLPTNPPRGQVQGSAPWKGPGGARLLPALPPRTERAPPGQLQLYQGPEPQILAAIDRRDDTFYVVSFRRDHLLLPARSHNKTSRPKMSLVMPAAALNASGRGRQPMMQVDCEVMDTRVIHVRRRRDTPTPRDTPPGGGDRP